MSAAETPEEIAARVVRSLADIHGAAEAEQWVAASLRAYGDARAAAEREWAAGVCRAAADAHRRTNREVRSQGGYDAAGPAGAVAALEAELARVASEIEAAVRRGPAARAD